MKNGKTTHDLRAWFGWTQQDFSDYFNIPLSTVKNWDARQCMPEYVENMMKEIRECWNIILKYERKQNDTV